MSEAFSRRLSYRKPAVTSGGGLVCAQNRIAAEIGARVLRDGGNAVDAAVAVGFAVPTVEPWMSGIGGGGAMVIGRVGESRVQTIDFGMRSPVGLNPADYPLIGGAGGDMFGWPAVVEDRNLKGATAIAVPGHVAGMGLALERFGTRGWAETLAPAIDLAERGVPVDGFTLALVASVAADLAADPGCRAAFTDGGFPIVPPLAAGETGWRATENLARTYRRLAEAGAQDFYTGDLARAIVREVQALGGSLSAEDLSGYRAVVEDAAVETYRDARIHVLPRLNGGPTLHRALGTLSGHRFITHRPDLPTYTAYAEALHEAFTQRFAEMGDSDDSRAPGCTTHITVVDKTGMMVSLTQTLLSLFGSRTLLPETGILMNNGINWFDTRPGGPNSLRPGRKVLANYSPAVGLTEAGGFAVGASGGRKIIGAVMQLISYLVDFRMTADEAMHQPRIDVSGTAGATVDEALGPEIVDGLVRRFGAVPALRTAYPFPYAVPSLITRTDGRNSGAAEISQPWAECVAEI